MYIYDLPHAEMKDLCRILDQNNKWEELAGTHMKYDNLTIQVNKRILTIIKISCNRPLLCVRNCADKFTEAYHRPRNY